MRFLSHTDFANGADFLLLHFQIIERNVRKTGEGYPIGTGIDLRIGSGTGSDAVPLSVLRTSLVSLTTQGGRATGSCYWIGRSTDRQTVCSPAAIFCSGTTGRLRDRTSRGLPAMGGRISYAAGRSGGIIPGCHRGTGTGEPGTTAADRGGGALSAGDRTIGKDVTDGRISQRGSTAGSRKGRGTRRDSNRPVTISDLTGGLRDRAGGGLTTMGGRHRTATG